MILYAKLCNFVLIKVYINIKLYVIYQTDNKKILTKFYKGLRTSDLEVMFVTDSSIYFKVSLIASALLSALFFQI